jgi:hypothetical protein
MEFAGGNSNKRVMNGRINRSAKNTTPNKTDSGSEDWIGKRGRIATISRQVNLRINRYSRDRSSALPFQLEEFSKGGDKRVTTLKNTIICNRTRLRSQENILDLFCHCIQRFPA